MPLEALAPLKDLFISVVVFLFSTAKGVIDVLFGLGQAALTRLLVVVALTIALYKPARKLAGPTIAFIIAFVVAVLGMRVLPESLLQLSMLHLIIAILIILFTFIFRLVWWLRQLLLAAAMITFASLWWWYGKQSQHLIATAIFLLLLILDYQIHAALATAREKAEKAKRLGAEIKILEKQIADAAAAGAKAEEIAALKKELDEKIAEKSKL